jgi:hypothetical protein
MSFFAGSVNRPAPSPSAPQAITLNNTPVATNVLGVPWPDLYGEFRCSGTSLAWTGSRVVPIYSTSTTAGGGAMGGKGLGASGGGGGGTTTTQTGNNFYRTFALGLCLGTVDSLLAIWIDKTLLWSGYVGKESQINAGYTPISTPRGTAYIYWGFPWQTQSLELSPYIPNIPYWRGCCYIVFQDFLVGTSDNLPPLEFVLRRYPTASPGANANAKQIGVGANPIYRVYELLTDPARGAMAPAAWLNLDGFAAAAVQMESGLGDCVTGVADLKSSCEDILGDMDTALIFSNGQFTPKLLRDRSADLALATDDILGVNKSPASWWESPTQANIKFKDYTRRFRDASVPLYAAGTALRRDDKVIQIDLPRVIDEGTARLIGMRKLILLRRALMPWTLKVNRAAHGLEVGDVITANASQYKLDSVNLYRVAKISESANDEIELTVVDDIFSSLPVIHAYVGGPGAPAGTPTPNNNYTPPPIPQITLKQAGELPWDIAGANKRVTLFAGRPASDCHGFSLYASLDGFDYDLVAASGAFHAGGTLYTATWPRYTLDRKASLDLMTDQQDIAGLTSQSDSGWFGLNLLIVIGSGIDAVVYAAKELFLMGGTRWRVTGLIGPLSDTVLGTPPTAGAPVFLFRLSPAYSVAALPSWTNGTTVYLKAIPYGARPSPDISAVSAVELPIVNRALRPFAPDNLFANNIGLAPTYSDDIVLSWMIRNRGIGPGYDTAPSPFAPSVTSEVDECAVEIWVNDVLKRTETATVKHATTTTTLTGTPAAMQFDVSDATGLQPGYRVGVTHDGIQYFARIASVTGNTVTLFGRGLPVAPSAGDALNCYEQIAFVYTSAMNVADNGAAADTVVARVYSKFNGLRSYRAAELTVVKA